LQIAESKKDPNGLKPRGGYTLVYITVTQSPRFYQLSLDDLIDGILKEVVFDDFGTSNTRTYIADNVSERRLEKIDVESMITYLRAFNIQFKSLFEADRRSLYEHFKIPKSSGGLRPIDAPLPDLKEALYQLKFILENRLHAKYHTSAFAYVRQRSTIDAIKKHQQNESKWFSKLDFSNFFGSTTLEFVMSQLSIIFPFNEIIKDEDGKKQLTQAMSLCFLNGGLPQGTPISPMLTNLLMIPLDHKLANTLRKFNNNKYVYTRYADDILISSKFNFKHQDIFNYVISVINEFNAPYKLNPDKSRYGSSAGSNWNLGVMLNKDNQITIGHRKKKQFKAMVNNFARNHVENIAWNLSDVQELNGLISYYKMVEKDNINYILNEYSKKYRIDIRAVIKSKLKTLTSVVQI